MKTLIIKATFKIGRKDTYELKNLNDERTIKQVADLIERYRDGEIKEFTIKTGEYD